MAAAPATLWFLLWSIGSLYSCLQNIYMIYVLITSSNSNTVRGSRARTCQPDLLKLKHYGISQLVPDNSIRDIQTKTNTKLPRTPGFTETD